MIPSIDDFTSYWIISRNYYIGILFGENILVKNNVIINLNHKTKNNSRIKKVCYQKIHIYYSYILFDNNCLYEIDPNNNVNLIASEVMDIYLHDSDFRLLHKDNSIRKKNMEIIKQLDGTAMIPNLPLCRTYYMLSYIYNKCIYSLQNYEKLCEIPNIETISDFIMMNYTLIILHNKKLTIIPDMMHNITLHDLTISGLQHISPYDENSILALFDDLSIGRIYINYTDESCNVIGKCVNIENSSYCVPFNAITCKYYPNWFKTRFFTFIMSLKFGINIKLPKYLFFIMANHLK